MLKKLHYFSTATINCSLPLLKIWKLKIVPSVVSVSVGEASGKCQPIFHTSFFHENHSPVSGRTGSLVPQQVLNFELFWLCLTLETLDFGLWTFDLCPSTRLAVQSGRYIIEAPDSASRLRAPVSIHCITSKSWCWIRRLNYRWHVGQSLD